MSTATAPTKMTRATVREYQAKLEEVLSAFGEEHGVSVSVGRVSFTDRAMTAKVEVALDSEGVDGQAEQEYRVFAPALDIDPDTFGRQFTHRGEIYTICGIKPRSPKYPIIARNRAGTTYKFPAVMANRVLAE